MGIREERTISTHIKEHSCSQNLPTKYRNVKNIKENINLTCFLQVGQREQMLVAVGLTHKPPDIVVLGCPDASGGEGLQTQQPQYTQ